MCLAQYNVVVSHHRLVRSGAKDAETRDSSLITMAFVSNHDFCLPFPSIIHRSIGHPIQACPAIPENARAACKYRHPRSIIHLPVLTLPDHEKRNE